MNFPFKNLRKNHFKLNICNIFNGLFFCNRNIIFAQVFLEKLPEMRQRIPFTSKKKIRSLTTFFEFSVKKQKKDLLMIFRKNIRKIFSLLMPLQNFIQSSVFVCHPRQKVMLLLLRQNSFFSVLTISPHSLIHPHHPQLLFISLPRPQNQLN